MSTPEQFVDSQRAQMPCAPRDITTLQEGLPLATLGQMETQEVATLILRFCFYCDCWVGVPYRQLEADYSRYLTTRAPNSTNSKYGVRAFVKGMEGLQAGGRVRFEYHGGEFVVFPTASLVERVFEHQEMSMGM